MRTLLARRPVRLLAPALMAGLALAACGGDEPDTAAATTVGSAPGASATAEFNDADVEFAQRMIVHHEQAIEMAEIAEDPARRAGPEVIALAARIKAAQDPEIETMTGWLTAWGQSVAMDTSDGHDMSSMTGMMSAEEMDGLAAFAGAGFDETWLTMMVKHHDGAIEMATAVQGEGVSADVRTLSAQIVAGQQAEVEEMNSLLDR